MAYYSVKSETLTGIANPVRGLNGLTGNLTPAQMQAALEDAHAESENQAALIAELRSEIAASGGDDFGSEWVARSLTEYSNHRVTTIGCRFSGNSLSSLDLPNVTTIQGNAFNGCNGLLEVTFPNVTSVALMAFYGCKAMVKADFHKSPSLASQSFRGCTALATVIIRGDTVATLGHTLTFDNTPIAEGTGYVYVPSALLTAYQAATNWSTFAAQFRAIENYPDICGEVSA